MLRKLPIYSLGLALIFVASAVYAQQAGLTRKVLQTADFPENYKIVQAYVVIAPGADVGKHYHPGIEVGYIIDGKLDLYVQGQPVQHLKTGDSFQNPDGVTHWAKNVNGDQPTKVLSTYVVDKSKPLATNVPD